MNSKVLELNNFLVRCSAHNPHAPWLHKTILYFDIVGEVGGPPICEDVVPNTSSSNIENFQENEVLQFVTIENQIVFWKPHHQNFVC